jgi:hypothetical protein
VGDAVGDRELLERPEAEEDERGPPDDGQHEHEAKPKRLARGADVPVDIVDERFETRRVDFTFR